MDGPSFNFICPETVKKNSKLAMKSLVISPTYNEKKNIVGLISTIMDLDKSFTVIVVDDNSPDKTYEVVSNFKNNLSVK